jgi:hypothetical protein
MNAASPTLPPLRITERDLAILAAIARYRLLSPPLLLRIVGGSSRGVANRLRVLTAHKYIIRLAAKITEPLAYGLANNGARYLAVRGHDINSRIDWTTENFRRSDHFRAHTLEVADTMLRFQRAAEENTISLVDHHDLLADIPEPTKNTARPFSVRVTIRHQHKPLTIAIVADRLFALVYPHARHNFALEQDLGTMDIWTNRLVGKSSIRRKHIAYFHAREQRHFADHWGFKSFRVLIVTTSDTRIDTMLRTQRHFLPNCPPGFFMYSTSQRLSRHGALGPAWVTIKRDNISLLDDAHALRRSETANANFNQRYRALATRRARQAFEHSPLNNFSSHPRA